MANNDTPRTYGHGSKESDIADVIGAHSGEDRAKAARASAGTTRTIQSPTAGEPPTIEGETIEQMRARVKSEREAAEPTLFQQSLVGRKPGEAPPGAPSGVDVTAGNMGGVAATGSGMSAGTAAAGGVTGAAAASTTGGTTAAR